MCESLYTTILSFLKKKRKTHENANYLFSVIPWSRCLIVLNWHCHLVSKIIPKCLPTTLRAKFSKLEKTLLNVRSILTMKKVYHCCNFMMDTPPNLRVCAWRNKSWSFQPSLLFRKVYFSAWNQTENSTSLSVYYWNKLPYTTMAGQNDLKVIHEQPKCTEQ